MYSEELNYVAALSDKKISTEKVKGRRTLECRSNGCLDRKNSAKRNKFKH